MVCPFLCFHYLYHSASQVDFSPEQCWTPVCCQTSLNGIADCGVHHPPDGETRKIQKDQKIHVLNLHPPWGKNKKNSKESKICSTNRLVALSKDCRRSSLQSLHLIFCQLWLRDQGLRLTEAQWYSLSHNLKTMVVLYEKMSQINSFKAQAAPAISLHSITFAAVVYTALTH